MIQDKIKNMIPDSIFLQLKYRKIMGRPLHLRHPQTFNEKLQWLKLHDRNPEYIKMVDKFEAKKYVADKIGDQYIIPTYGVWDSFDEIDFNALPEQFVLKCVHDSGGIVICTDKKSFDMNAAREKLNSCLKRNYYWVGREWPYKNIKPRIIAEKYMVDESSVELKDYKVHNFGGEPKVIQVDYGRFSEHMRNLYTTDWEYLEAAIKYPTNVEFSISRPQKLDEMLMIAKKLSQGIPYVRTDFYSIEDKVYFGEITFYHGSGMGEFEPEAFDIEMGSWIKLPSGGGYYLKNDGYMLWLHETIEKQDMGKESKKDGLKDYKFMCFNGKVMCSFACSDRFSSDGLKVTFYDRNWNRMPFTRHYPASKQDIERPKHYDKMLQFSEILSEIMPFVRVDFYEINGHLYFGELTLYPGDGMEEFTPEKWDYELGSWLKLPTNVAH